MMPAASAPILLGAVVVTYFPDSEFPSRLAAILREIPACIVVDNTTDPTVRANLAALCTRLDCEFLAQPDNTGLGTALNAGFAIHAARGAREVVAFDQDSTPQPGFASALLNTRRAVKGLGVIGANWQDQGRPGSPSLHLRRHLLPPFFRRSAARTDLFDVTCVITSGTLFDVALWRELGGFDTGLFLDLVDTDFCLRTRAAGRAVGVSATARLAHRRGAKQPIRRLGRTWWPAFMPPLRLRYVARNRIHLLTRHGLREPHWAAFELCFAAKLIVDILLLENDSLAKIAASLRGTWDGLLGSTGKFQE